MRQMASAGCAVQMIFVNKHEVSGFQRVPSVTDIIVTLPGQQIIYFVEIMEMVGVHIEMPDAPQLLNLKNRFHPALSPLNG